MQIKAIKTKIFRENEELIPFIFKYIKKLPERSILAVTSKIVALFEGRTVEFKSEKQKVALIKKESDFAVKTRYVWLTIKDDMVMASAGIDESNAKGKLFIEIRNGRLISYGYAFSEDKNWKEKDKNYLMNFSSYLYFSLM